MEGTHRKIGESSSNRLLQAAYSVDETVGRVGEIFSVACLVVLLVIIFSQVFCRFLLGFSITGSEEIGRYLLIWLTFTGFGVLARGKRLLSVSIIVDRLPRRPRSVVKALANAGSLFFLVVVCYYGFVLAGLTMRNVTVVTRIPMGYVYLCIPCGAALYILHLVIDILRDTERESGRK